MEELLGEKLLKKVGTPPVATEEALKGKDLVLLYFSASWCPPCKAFSPQLARFYNNVAKEQKIEVVFVSSDRSVEAFNNYFEHMPWLAIPADAGAAGIKNKLAQALKISGIPSLVVMDAKTGKFVTDQARNEVMAAGDDKSRQKDVVASWKKKEAVFIHEAQLGQPAQQTQNPVLRILFYILKNPMYIVGIIYLAKRAIKWLKEQQPGGGEL